MNIPEELHYTSDHEWAGEDDSGVRIGITDFAQEALGDVVFVDLPAIGATLDKGSKLGEVESTKSVSEVYTPVSGTVVSVNDALVTAPERLNEDPYGEGWLCVVQPTEEDPLRDLLDAAAYRDLTLA